MTTKEIEDQIIKEFSSLDDWLDKYNYLIELGKSLSKIDEQYKTEQYVITGCQSNVWLQSEYKNGKIYFKADSDAIITKGIVALLICVLNDHTPDEILNASMDYIDKIGLKDHLSPTRANGLTSMIKQMKLYALAYKTKELNAEGKES
jgi:cysteine desulfuration protein SufE